MPNVEAQDASVQALVLALGSNTDANALDAAIEHLSGLGALRLSDRISGADFTGRSSRIYHNQCVSLDLFHRITKSQLIAQLKQIERACGRNPDKKTAEYDFEVVMDIDVLALKIADAWHNQVMKFKTHEEQGVAQIAPVLLNLK